MERSDKVTGSSNNLEQTEESERAKEKRPLNGLFFLTEGQREMGF
jgi:hypothetical protein